MKIKTNISFFNKNNKDIKLVIHFNNNVWQTVLVKFYQIYNKPKHKNN
jgi:hypothetical protein